MERSELRTRAREGTFVGREPELTYGLNALDDAVAGSSRLLLLAGEPGIGKSRLADELAQRARRRDVRVAWGRCWEAGGAPAYWPWVQSLRAIARELGAETLRALLPPGAAEVSQLLPELGAAAATSPPAPSPQDPDAARFLLFDSVTMLLINIAAAKPLMLVLDDLQVADTASLLLLQFAAAALGDERVLIVGTYRDQGLGRDHPLTSTLVELQREPITRLLSLRGFSEDDVAHVIGAAAGIAPQPQLVRALHAETEGNPFFVQELVRVLVEEGRLGEGAKHQSLTQPIPRSVREVIGSRLKPLTPESRAVLELASIFGREFDVHALSRLAEHSVDSVIEQLDEPLAMGVVTRSPGGGDVLRFSHVLVRDSLHDDIGRTRRTELHHRAAEVLEILYQADPEPHLAELAHHFFEGMSWKDAAKVVTYCRRAAQAAAGLLAYEEAVRLFRMALDATDRAGIEDPEQRCELLLALGEAQARAGDEAGSKQTLLAAAELTKELGEPALLARAALGYSGRLVWVRAGGDPHLI
ncbi:MAG TPA: AAA family ATPase, partial [Candidatus Dormibacteraeota bacterium]|nr:AAA family ATPase [Candidatus Dormibacteraeota bacterium]